MQRRVVSDHVQNHKATTNKQTYCNAMMDDIADGDEPSILEFHPQSSKWPVSKSSKWPVCLFFARRSHLPCIDCATTCNLVNVHCSAHGLELLRPPASKKGARLAFSSHAGRGSENGNDEISDLPLATLPASPPHKAAVKPPRFSSLTHSPTYKKRLLPMHTPTNMDGSTALDRS